MKLNGSQQKKLTKWIIGILTVCILIYLGVKNIDVLASAVSWLFSLLSPLVLGFVFALVLNVPMRFFEGILWRNTKKKFAVKLRRPVAFLLSFVIISGILIGVVWLVIPELIDAGTIIVKGAINLANELANADKDSELYQRLEGIVIQIDWNKIGTNLQSWLANTGTRLMNSAVSTVTSLVGGIFNFVISFIFSIYILFSKETLKAQLARLVHAWLPENFGDWLIHAGSVASGVFRNFVSGQTIEAMILGVLCMLGMLILRIPYAPMVGAFVGVTALIPVVGAYLGAFVGVFMIMTVDPLKALVFLVFLIVLQQLEGNLIYPKVMGSRVKLPSLWILAAVTVGGALAGTVGMLLGVPLASTAYILLREATEKREEKIKAEKIVGDNNDGIINAE